MQKEVSTIRFVAIILSICVLACAETPGQNTNRNYYKVLKTSTGQFRLVSPEGQEFYMRGIVYAPLEGDGPDYLGDLYGELRPEDFSAFKDAPNAPPIRKDLAGLNADLDLIAAAGFNQIKLWNVTGLSRMGLLQPFLLAAQKKKIGVMLALVGPSDGWQLSADPKKLATFTDELKRLAKETRGIPSVISINVYAPEIRNNYPTAKTSEIIGVFASAIKAEDPNRLVAVFIDRDPKYFEFPKTWTDNVDLIGIQPYSPQRDSLDRARINNDVNYYLQNGNTKPVFIDEWGLRTQAAVGTHSVVPADLMETRLIEFLRHVESLNLAGWSYFMLRDKVWEGDFGILGYRDGQLTKKRSFEVLRRHNVSIGK